MHPPKGTGLRLSWTDESSRRQPRTLGLREEEGNGPRLPITVLPYGVPSTNSAGSFRWELQLKTYCHCEEMMPSLPTNPSVPPCFLLISDLYKTSGPWQLGILFLPRSCPVSCVGSTVGLTLAELDRWNPTQPSAVPDHPYPSFLPATAIGSNTRHLIASEDNPYYCSRFLNLPASPPPPAHHLPPTHT